MKKNFFEFVNLSAAITGFSRVDLEATGVAEEYWSTLNEEAGQSIVDALLAAWKEVEEETDGSSQSLETALRGRIFNNANLRPTARTLLKMWYTGQWGDNATKTVSNESYMQGLVWTAINTHPAGAKQPGFGTWSLPPDYLENTS